MTAPIKKTPTASPSLYFAMCKAKTGLPKKSSYTQGGEKQFRISIFSAAMNARILVRTCAFFLAVLGFSCGLTSYAIAYESQDKSAQITLIQEALSGQLLQVAKVRMVAASNIHDHRGNRKVVTTQRVTHPIIHDQRRDKQISAKDCRSGKTMEVLAPAKQSAKTVKIDCNLRLKGNHVVTKRMIFEGDSASGVTVNCNQATLNGGKGTINYKKDMIEVRSQKFGARWVRPQNVTITNCNIIGSVRIWGMGKNGEQQDIKESSRRERQKSSAHLHVQRVRDNAPKNIVLDNVTITGMGRNPLYFAPGVTYSKLINSEMKGKSNKVGIYFDAESAYNTLENNYIHVDTKKDGWGRLPGVRSRGWPLIAIDGSTGNKIINNKFSNLNNGGIYLYRNCGEGGTIRHTTPSRNSIINNTFVYKKYKGRNPAVYIGSRDYGFKERHPGHCDKDDGRPYGSSVSEKDYARHNIVMQNQFYKRPVSKGNFPVAATLNDYIKINNRSVNSNNKLDRNKIISSKK